MITACDICNQYHLSSAEEFKCEMEAWDRATEHDIKEINL